MHELSSSSDSEESTPEKKPKKIKPAPPKFDETKYNYSNKTYSYLRLKMHKNKFYNPFLPEKMKEYYDFQKKNYIENCKYMLKSYNKEDSVLSTPNTDNPEKHHQSEILVRKKTTSYDQIKIPLTSLPKK